MHTMTWSMSFPAWNRAILSPALIMSAKNSYELNFILQTSYAPSFAKIRIEETSHSQIQRRWSFWNLLYLLGWFWRRGQVTDFAMRPRLSFQGKFIEGFWQLFKKAIKQILSNCSIQLKNCNFEPFCIFINRKSCQIFLFNSKTGTTESLAPNTTFVLIFISADMYRVSESELI